MEENHHSRQGCARIDRLPGHLSRPRGTRLKPMISQIIWWRIHEGRGADIHGPPSALWAHGNRHT
jgi:hypothetical protein